MCPSGPVFGSTSPVSVVSLGSLMAVFVSPCSISLSAGPSGTRLFRTALVIVYFVLIVFTTGMWGVVLLTRVSTLGMSGEVLFGRGECGGLRGVT